MNCKHLGPATGELVGCKSCTDTKLKIFTCGVHGTCTIAKPGGMACCDKCPDFRMPEQPEITVRNLIYHVAPITENDGWRSNINRLLEFSSDGRGGSIFNGRKVVAISTGDNMHPPQEVREAFAKLPGVEFLEIPNDLNLREVATFRPLLESVRNTNSNEATFYAHTKGNSTAGNKLGALYWRNSMYHHLLTRAEEVRDHLRRHVFVGTHKFHWRGGMSPFPSKLKPPNGGNWMHAGTFFWFRHDGVFTNERWQKIPNDRYGAEAWPCIACQDSRLSHSIYQPWPDDQPRHNVYSPDVHEPKIANEDELLDLQRGGNRVIEKMEAEHPRSVIMIQPQEINLRKFEPDPIPILSVDRIHRNWIYDVLMSGRFPRVLEIGVYHGYSSSAILGAIDKGQVRAATFCDIHITDEFRKSAARSVKGGAITIHEGRSVDFLKLGERFDFVLVDGDHSTENVIEEVKILLESKTTTIMAHDTGMGGLDDSSGKRWVSLGQNGPPNLKNMLQAAGYRCLDDSLWREGMNTERGMLFATTGIKEFKAGLDAFRRHIYGDTTA